jgi:hypothetical protein
LQIKEQQDRIKDDHAMTQAMLNWDGKSDLAMMVLKALSDHPKPANEGHLKTGQR